MSTFFERLARLLGRAPDGPLFAYQRCVLPPDPIYRHAAVYDLIVSPRQQDLFQVQCGETQVPWALFLQVGAN